MFLMYSDDFDVPISKIIIKKLKKNCSDIFLNKKHFKKQPPPKFLAGQE